MRSTFKILFYVKKGSEKSNDNLPLMCRLTVDGEVKQFSCKMDVPKRIVEKYKGMGRDNHVFKVPSNSACNEKLKDIAKQCGIKTRVTYHVARHSAATTILLSNGVPLETVSRLLGHTNIKTTQIYAKITNQKISQDMAELSAKLENMEKSICNAI